MLESVEKTIKQIIEVQDFYNLEERLKVTDPNGTDPEISYYEADEYLELLEDFIDKSEDVIKYRTNKIIEALNKKL